jgi:NitT/TauT family transport system substrate-binding protein
MRFAFILMALLGLAGGARAEDAPEQPHIGIGVTGVSNFVGVWVAADHGIFAKHGLSADITVVKEGSTAIAGLVSGNFAFATPTPSVFLQAVDSGLDIVVAAPTHIYPTPNLVGILARPDSNIHEAKDLVGRRYGVPGIGGLQDVLTRQWLIQSGVDPSKVIYVELSFAQMNEALRSHQVDALTSGEPFYQRIIEAKNGVPVFDLRSIITPGTLGSMYASTREWVQTHPKTLAAFRASLADAIEVIKADPEEGKKSIAKWMKLPPDVMALISVPNVTLKTDPKQMDFWIKVCLQQGMISKPIKAEQVIWP